MAHAEEDKWEYEYDENETEDFYIPIDLANVPAVQGAIDMRTNTNPSQRGHAMLLKTKLRNIDRERREAEINSAVQNAEDASTSIGQIQIIGLHTENPLVMYNDQLLSCQWNKTIGTELIFAKPNQDDAQTEEPLRSLPSVDLLATGSAKLVARVARMRPREGLFDDEDGEENEDAPMTTEDSASTRTQPALPAPSSFLDRLNEAKAKRGETSRLALSATANGSRLVAVPKENAIGGEGEDTVMGGT